MKWLDHIVHSFIMTFGITPPSPEKKQIANVFIGSLLLFVILAFLGILFFGVTRLVR